MDPKFSKERRDVLKGACTLVGATAAMSLGASLPAFAATQAAGVPQAGDVFVFADGANKGKVVNVADVVLDAPPVTVQAKDPAGAVRDGDNSTVLLYRVAPAKIDPDMAGDTVEGVMAYSAVCTHLGCMLTNWDPRTNEFLCPCHDALFDPLKEGKNTGGATCRSLPYIPIKSDGGKIVVSGPPSGYVGVKRSA